jgi:hypothetical protein
MERRLAAILSADVKGYRRLMGEDEVATIGTLTTYREVMSTLIQQHRGRVVDSPGDNLLAEFASVVEAVQCAVATQWELQARNAELPPHRRMKFRIGINLGDVVVEGEQIYGEAASRDAPRVWPLRNDYLHEIIQRCHLAHGDRHAVRRVVSSDGGRIGRAPIDGDPVGHVVAADCLGEEARGRLLVPLLRQEKVQGLSHLIHGAIKAAPLAFDLDIGLSHPPADPHRPLAAMERRFERRTIFQHPAMDGRVVDRHPTLLHELFHPAVASGRGHIPPHAREDNGLPKVGPLAAHHALSPSRCILGHRGRSSPKWHANENVRQIRSSSGCAAVHSPSVAGLRKAWIPLYSSSVEQLGTHKQHGQIYTANGGGFDPGEEAKTRHSCGSISARWLFPYPAQRWPKSSVLVRMASAASATKSEKPGKLSF